MQDLNSLYSLTVRCGRFTPEALSWLKKTLPIQYIKIGECPQNELYDPYTDIEQEIRVSLSRAMQGDKRVLLVYGGNWCTWCKRLHECFTQNNEVEKILKQRYEVVRIDVNTNEATLRRFNTNPDGYPYLTVLDADGRVLKHQSTSVFVDEGRHVAQKVYDFLAKWRIQPSIE